MFGLGAAFQACADPEPTSFTLQSSALGGVLRFGDDLPRLFLMPALILPSSSVQIRLGAAMLSPYFHPLGEALLISIGAFSIMCGIALDGGRLEPSRQGCCRFRRVRGHVALGRI
ncbi:hypothetical protein PHAMO_180049 [Magnetospirillum molischianum DSM 120]|uniref:Uncharacterized protein n=1 Tax=Magnetospirillum molischianum DSM 120 TaxID=1150626 RepID=H8FNZ2_MAGML|nr:hypothetical protein PHAMO_180049 [Magnetospirillum molischianum DSM 120]